MTSCTTGTEHAWRNIAWQLRDALSRVLDAATHTPLDTWSARREADQALADFADLDHTDPDPRARH